MTEQAPLIEQADAAFAAGQLEPALRLYAGLLEQDPSDGYLWYRTAVTLSWIGQRAEAARSLEHLPLALADGGQLMLALAALKELEALTPALAHAKAREVAAIYGAGSPRIEQRPAPPPTPQRISQADMGQFRTAEPRALYVLAEAACDKAAQLAERRDRYAPVPYHPLLSDLQPAHLAELVPSLTLQLVASSNAVITEGDVIKEGDAGDAIYLIVRGTARVSRGESHLAYLRSGAFFGEMALLTRSPRSASVHAVEPLIILELGRRSLEELAARKPEVAGVLADYTRRRLLDNLMATSPIFAPLERERKIELVRLFDSRVFAPGQNVLEEGGASAGLYVVLNGSVRVSKQEGKDQLTLAELGPGQVFGEISLLQHRAATATVTALDKSVVLSLSREAFNAHVATFPEVLAHIYKLASEREAANLALVSVEALPLEQEGESLLI